MRRIPVILILLITCIGCYLCFYGSVSQADETSFPVSGYVVSLDGSPIAGALVKLMSTALAETTDVYGFFRFNSVPPGSYQLTISISHLGLEDIRRTITVPLVDNNPLRIVTYDRIYELDEVVVISKRPETYLEERYPSSVTIALRSEFDGISTTVADVIKTMPSVTIQSMGGLGDHTEISLRGSNANQVHVYLDGMLLNEAVGGPVNLATIPLAHVRSIEVWRSGAPSRFGGDAAGGVVNIRTLEMAPARETFTIGYGSFNTVNANAILLFPMKMSKMLVSADYSSSDNTFPFKSDNGTMYNTEDDFWTHRRNDGYRSLNILSKYRHVIGNSLLNISEHLLSSKKQLPGRDIVQQSEASLSTIRNLFQVKFTTFLMGDRIEAEPTFYHLLTYETYKDPGGRVGWGVQDNIYQTSALRFNSPFTLKEGNHTVVHVTPAIDYEQFKPNHKLQVTVPLSCERKHYSLVIDAIFTGLANHFTLTSSVRRDRYDSSFSGQTSPVNRIPPKPKTNLMTNWHAGAKLTLTNNFSVRCNYGDVTRVPGFYELFGDRGTTLSNPNLKPERIRKWDAGGKVRYNPSWLPASFIFECVYFANRHNDLIQWYTNDAGFVSPDNVARTYVKGTELVWSSRLFRHLVCSGNWTFQKSQVKKEKRVIYINKQLPNRPSNYGNIKIKYILGSIVPFWQMTRKGPYYLDRANQRHKRYPGRTMHNAGLSFTINKKVRFSLLTQNITDVLTFDTQGMPIPGRSYSISATYMTE